MTILNEDDGILGGHQGEQIQVRVGFGSVVDFVTFVRNGSSGRIDKDQTLQFTLQSDCLLTLTFHFLTQQSGQYSVQIQGQGGPTFNQSLLQDFGVPTEIVSYNFLVS